jgi:hypothetical protein
MNNQQQMSIQISYHSSRIDDMETSSNRSRSRSGSRQSSSQRRPVAGENSKLRGLPTTFEGIEDETNNRSSLREERVQTFPKTDELERSLNRTRQERLTRVNLVHPERTALPVLPYPPSSRNWLVKYVNYHDLRDFCSILVTMKSKVAVIEGHIVAFNITKFSSDAFLVTTDRIWSIRLPELEFDISQEKAVSFRLRMDSLRLATCSNTRKELKSLLEWLWDAAIRQLLDELGISDSADGTGKLPHI